MLHRKTDGKKMAGREGGNRAGRKMGASRAGTGRRRGDTRRQNRHARKRADREGGRGRQQREEARGTGPNWHDSRKGKKNRRPQKVGRSGNPPSSHPPILRLPPCRPSSIPLPGVSLNARLTNPARRPVRRLTRLLFSPQTNNCPSPPWKPLRENEKIKNGKERFCRVRAAHRRGGEGWSETDGKNGEGGRMTGRRLVQVGVTGTSGTA
jgi:hypothetical protein